MITLIRLGISKNVMKNILLIFLFFCCSILTTAQTYFNERYNLYYTEGLDFAHNIIEFDSGYIIAGGCARENQDYRLEVVLSKLNSIGQLVNSKAINDDTWSYDIGPDGSVKHNNNNEITAVGARRRSTGSFVRDEGVIYKFSYDLDTLWTRTIGDNQFPDDTNYQFRGLEVLPNNELIIAGHIIVDGATSKALLIKTDSLGNELWRKYYNNGPINIGVDVISTPDNGFVISCYLWTFGTHQISAPYIVKTDSLGNEQWRHYINWLDQLHGEMSIINSPDSTIIGVYSYSDSVGYPSSDSYNRITLIKLDLEGELIWEKKYGTAEFNNYVKSLKINDNGKVIMAGIKYSPFPHRIGYMQNCDTNGDLLWYREYENLIEYDSYNFMNGVTPTNDGGYIGVGDVLPYPPDIGNQDVWLIKVDSMGCESWNDCWVGETEHIALRNEEKLVIYPNPASRAINIFIPKENESETHNLVIFDIYGRKVEETEVGMGETTISFNVTGWKDGLYTVITSYNRKISGRGKFVVN